MGDNPIVERRDPQGASDFNNLLFCEVDMGLCQDWEDDFEGPDEWDKSCSPVKSCELESSDDEDSPKPVKPESK